MGRISRTRFWKFFFAPSSLPSRTCHYIDYRDYGDSKKKKKKNVGFGKVAEIGIPPILFLSPPRNQLSKQRNSGYGASRARLQFLRPVIVSRMSNRWNKARERWTRKKLASTAERKHVYPVNVDREMDRMEERERGGGAERLPVREQLSRANRATCQPRKLARVAYIDLVR